MIEFVDGPLLSSFRNPTLLLSSVWEKERHVYSSPWVLSGCVTMVWGLEQHETRATRGQLVGPMRAQECV